MDTSKQKIVKMQIGSNPSISSQEFNFPSN
jgi:hypothetical protein